MMPLPSISYLVALIMRDDERSVQESYTDHGPAWKKRLECTRPLSLTVPYDEEKTSRTVSARPGKAQAMKKERADMG